jgi:Ca2+-binding EF-hand superfamily protein
MRTTFVLVVVLAAATGFSLAAEKPAAPPPLRPVPGDAQDLVLFLESRPYLIRLHVQIQGRSFRGNWEETIGQLFRYLDVDGDGTLNAKETALAPSKTQWVQLMTGIVVEPDAAPEFAELAGDAKATKISRTAFSRYYRHSGAGALQVEWGWRPGAQDQLSDVLFQQLDKDKDGNLSRAELLAAQTALRALDTNGDELIQARELAPNSFQPDFIYRSTTEQRPVPHNFPFFLVQPDAPAASLVNEILHRYDRGNKRKLSRTELRLEKAAFARLDANSDGQLDAAELAKWRKSPPDVELIAALERGARKDILLMPGADGNVNRLATLKPPSRDGVLRLPVEENQLEVVRDPASATRRQQLLKQFDTLANKDGVLEEKKIYQPPFTFVALLRLADRDGDNRLSRKEVADYLEVQEKFPFRVSYLTVVDRGPSLFEFLDADHDGRLSPRELRTAWQRLSLWDRDGKQRVTRQQVPRQFQLILSYGRPRSTLPASGPRFADLPMLRDRSRGPLWFRKMDRNGDGDVSQTEFLGTADQFRKIDSDGDGLIDVQEAERADQQLRKRP